MCRSNGAAANTGHAASRDARMVKITAILIFIVIVFLSMERIVFNRAIKTIIIQITRSVNPEVIRSHRPGN
jgi:hypothetical protein